MSDDNSDRLAGLRVLVIEDETLVAMLLEDMLSDVGCQVVGPVPRVSKALEIVTDPAVALDVAILDVNVAGEEVFPVAEALAGRGVPFAFATGYGDSGVRDPWRNRPVLQKPFRQEQITAVLVRALDDR
jgi:DNA-binding NtrC family response regulator